jgi:hypothetical protein
MPQAKPKETDKANKATTYLPMVPVCRLEKLLVKSKLVKFFKLDLERLATLDLLLVDERAPPPPGAAGTSSVLP